MSLGDYDYYIGMIQMLKLFYDKTGEILYPDEVLCTDLEYEIYHEVLQLCTKYTKNYYYKESDETQMIFYDDKMTEFYRLCKEYGRKHNIKFKDNPYVKKAGSEVYSYFDTIPDYSFDWKIQIGTHHQFASSLYFYTGPDFIQTCCAVKAIYDSFNYYAEALEEIRKELFSCTALIVYKPPINLFTERKAA